MLKISDIRIRDVINVLDGRRLGYIKDIELDVEKGKVNSLIMPGSNRFLGLFGRQEDLVVPWEQIVKMGVDVILVKANNYTNLDHNQQEEV